MTMKNQLIVSINIKSLMCSVVVDHNLIQVILLVTKRLLTGYLIFDKTIKQIVFIHQSLADSTIH